MKHFECISAPHGNSSYKFSIQHFYNNLNSDRWLKSSYSKWTLTSDQSVLCDVSRPTSSCLWFSPSVCLTSVLKVFKFSSGKKKKKKRHLVLLLTSVQSLKPQFEWKWTFRAWISPRSTMFSVFRAAGLWCDTCPCVQFSSSVAHPRTCWS